MTDHAKRLRKLARNDYNAGYLQYAKTLNEAADKLDQLREALRAARESWYCENCGCERCLQAEALKDD